MPHELLADMPIVIELPVQWGEMDAYQHVNNVVYFRYFESARLAWITRIGWPEHEKRTGVGPILSATQAKYRRPLTYPDTISVSASVLELKQDRIILAHRVVSHAQKAVTTEGESTVVTYHYSRGEKVLVPDELRRQIESLEGRSFPLIDS